MRLVRYQLIAFVVVTVLGIGYAMSSYVGLGQILGIGQFRVSVELPAAGGLYANAAVTENGVTVGKVTSLRLSQQGAVASISINRGTKIPSNLHATVASTSAVGEQYLNLTPKSQGGPYLAAGDVIPVSEVSLPPNVSSVLGSLNSLLRSVPRRQLNTTINELYNGFNGTGPQLRRLLASSGALLNAASQNITPTKNLIDEANPVLATQARNAANIRAFSRNLDEFTTQLRSSDKDLAGAIGQAPGLTSQLDDLIGQLQPVVPLLLSNLTSTGQVFKVYLPNVQQTLVVFPADINDLTADGLDSPAHGTIGMNVVAQVGSPCTQGYGSVTQRQPSDTSYKPPPRRPPYCTVPHSSPLQVRGSHNDPCPNNPSLRAAYAAGCGLNFGSGAGAPGAGAGSSGSRPGGGTSAAGYDPSTGLLVGPGGLLYSVGPGSRNGTGPATLEGLLKQTLG